MTKSFDAEQVRQVLRENMESDFPDRVLKVLLQFDGKRLTKPVANKLFEVLPQEGAPWHLTTIASHTNLQTDAYFRSQDKEPSYSFLMAYTTGIITVNVNDILKYNPSHFEARDRRNALRQEALESDLLCQQMAQTLNATLVARQVLAAAEARLKDLCGYGKPFSPSDTLWWTLSGRDNKNG